MLKLCTMIEYFNPACNVMLISHVINRRLPQAIHYNGKIICVLLASDITYDYETLSYGYAHQNI